METSLIDGLKTLEVIATFFFGIAAIFGANLTFGWACCATVFVALAYVMIKFKCYEPLSKLANSISKED